VKSSYLFYGALSQQAKGKNYHWKGRKKVILSIHPKESGLDERGKKKRQSTNEGGSLSREGTILSTTHLRKEGGFTLYLH